MRYLRLLTAALLIAPLAARGVGQVSLWSGGAGASEANLLQATKASDFKIHDILHIVVSVSAESSTDEAVDMEKESNKNKIAIEQYIKLQANGLGLPYLRGHSPDNLGLDISGGKTFEGEGTTDRKDTLRTRLAAEIVDIKPNGHLVVEAKSRFTKSRETTTITLSGIVRPQDVGPDNLVYSYNVADADIKYESSGPVTDANRRGWLTKILDKLWPF